VRSDEAKVTSVERGDTVELSVSQLSPGTNYTLLIYAENSIGRSTAAFTVYAYTVGMKFRFVLPLSPSATPIRFLQFPSTGPSL